MSPYAEGFCWNCREIGLLPLGRTRRDGSRHPMRYCDRCLSSLNTGRIRQLVGGGPESHRYANRLSMRRLRAVS